MVRYSQHMKGEACLLKNCHDYECYGISFLNCCSLHGECVVNAFRKCVSGYWWSGSEGVTTLFLHQIDVPLEFPMPVEVDSIRELGYWLKKICWGMGKERDEGRFNWNISIKDPGQEKKQQMLSIFVNCCFVILRKLMQNTFDSCVSVD